MASKETTQRRAARIRRQIKAVSNGRPRLSVHRSSKHIYAQIIDDGSAPRGAGWFPWKPWFCSCLVRRSLPYAVGSKTSRDSAPWR